MEAIKRAITAFKAASMPVRLIAVNGALFVALRLAVIIGLLAGAADPLSAVLSAVELPSSLPALLMAPWTVVTYMFAQYDILHLAFNLLWLYWFGQVMLLRCSPSQLLTLYLYGGLAGAALFIVAFNLLPLFAGTTGMLIGSSAAVMAIVTATAILLPDFRMQLLLIGSIKLKWIACGAALLVLLGASGSNAGGEMAHAGGIIAGAIFATQLRRGHDITAPARKLSARIASALTPAAKPTHTPTIPPDPQADLDIILDKIKRSGYSALTPDERRRLFEISRKIK